MSYTKREIIAEAFNEIGLGSFAYSLQPEDQQTAVRRLNTMLATWEGKGINTGFTPNTEPSEGSLDDDSGLLSQEIEPVILNLACAIAPAFGKSVSRDTKIGAARGLKFLRRESVVLPERKIDTTAVPAGAGHKLTDITVLSEDELDEETLEITGIVIL